MNIFVGNLSFQAKEADVYQAFAAFGKVSTVTIIMEKKGDKSRGFGFVEMADDNEALAAIAGLHEKELLDRPLNVMPAQPKKPKKERPVVAAREPKKEFIPRPKADFTRTGGHRKGRRSISFMKKNSEAGIAPAPKKEFKENPMRWRKKSEQRRPWEKSSGGFKPWDKAKGESKPGEKAVGEAKPWKKTFSSSKPWEKKATGEARPWKKAKGESKWKKAAPGGKPWDKPKKVAKHWEKHLSAVKATKKE
ncbi:MAG: hypothetical protein V1650_04165 [Candidatus Omnitrophota bacterium]